MTTTSTRTRQPKGAPIGGEFAVETHAEAVGVDLLADTKPETVFTKRYETLDDKIEAFQSELNDAVAGLAEDENWQGYLETMGKFHRYSMFNQMLIAVQCPDATRVAGYRKWEEFGRHVNKGEKAIGIFAPKMVRITETNGAGKPVKDAKGKLVKRSRCVGFTTASVFDVSQTDGEPLPTVDRELSETPPEGFKEDLEAAITDAGFTVSYEKITGGASGFTEPASKRVVVDSALSPANTAQVLAHELGHIKAGHLDHMDEYHSGHGGNRGQFELQADAIAAVVGRANGMSSAVSKVSSYYIAGWNRDNPDAMKESAQTVSKTVKSILETGTWRNAEAVA